MESSKILTLTALPPEILLLIIEIVDSDWQLERRGETRRYRPRYQRMWGQDRPYSLSPDIQSLSVVNKSLRAVCLPKRWKTIKLYPCDIRYPIVELLTRYGSLVHSVTLDLSHQCSYDPAPEVPKDNDSALQVAPEEVFSALALCHRQSSLVVYLPHPCDGSQDSECKTEKQHEIQVLSFLARLVLHLNPLRQFVFGPGFFPERGAIGERIILKLIRLSPLLESFTCYGFYGLTDEDLEEDETMELGQALSKLRHLTHLHLTGVECVDVSAWCNYSWPGTLKEMSFEHCLIRPTESARLFNHIAPHATHLEFYHSQELDPDSIGDLDPSWLHSDAFPYNLHSLTYVQTVSILGLNEMTRFKGCQKLKCINYADGLRTEGAEFANLVIRSTWPELQRIELDSWSGIDEELLKKFKGYCDKKGIEVLVYWDSP